MANPRRGSLHIHHSQPPLPLLPLSLSSSSSEQSPHSIPAAAAAFLSAFLKRPQAFPILLSLFVLLTWLSLRFHRPLPPPITTSSSASRSGTLDSNANLFRYRASGISADPRGWLLDPSAAARDAGILGGAQTCASVHVGEIKPGGVRGNHRHHTCNETFIIWGAATKFRLENAHVDNKAYAEAVVNEDEVAVATSPSGTAHALINIDPIRTTFFLGCQDSVIHNTSTTDYKVWKEL